MKPVRVFVFKYLRVAISPLPNLITHYALRIMNYLDCFCIYIILRLGVKHFFVVSAGDL